MRKLRKRQPRLSQEKCLRNVVATAIVFAFLGAFAFKSAMRAFHHVYLGFTLITIMVFVVYWLRILSGLATK